LTWKEKSLKGLEFSKIATTSDEAFTLFAMRDYATIPKKGDDKKKTSWWELGWRVQWSSSMT